MPRREPDRSVIVFSQSFADHVHEPEVAQIVLPGEIDIVARQDATIVFVEVKTRQTEDFGAPQYAVNAAKRKQISKAALSYIREKKLTEQSCRFDVIAVSFLPESRKPKVEHIENAFELSRRYTY